MNGLGWLFVTNLLGLLVAFGFHLWDPSIGVGEAHGRAAFVIANVALAHTWAKDGK